MPDVTCAEARALLRAATGGARAEPGWVWDELRKRGAVEGTSDAPKVTPVGEHVLKELEIRSDRCDPWSLDRLADELSRVQGEIEGQARNAEYFLTNLGPITPSEAVPYLRIVAVGLAKRRENPDDLTERFRNVWGMVEVMGGDARDRLMGAELLTGTEVSMGAVYAPMMTTVERLRSMGATTAVASAAILQLDDSKNAAPVVERWANARRSLPTDESAALMATILGSPDRQRRFEEFRSRFDAAGNLGGKVSAAMVLACSSADPARATSHVIDGARRLSTNTQRPLLMAALLGGHHPLSGSEMADWVAKGADAAARVQLAANTPEFYALGAAIVEGLPSSTFADGDAPSGSDLDPLASAATLLAFHAWIYRPLLDPTFEKSAGAPARTAAPT